MVARANVHWTFDDGSNLIWDPLIKRWILEDVDGISVSSEDTPESGGMIARNSNNHNDKWYIAKDFFENNYEELYDDNDD